MNECDGKNIIESQREVSYIRKGYTVGKLLDGMECQILLDTGVSKSLMSKTHFMRHKSLYLLPKFASKHREFK